MTEHVDKFKLCCSSPNLRERHDALIWLIEETVPVFNREIGAIGGAAIQEIMEAQARYEPRAATAYLPFSHEHDDHNTYLKIILGTVAVEGEEPYPIGIHAETPWHNTWYYQGYGASNEGIAVEVRELGREDVAVAAQRLSMAMVLLNKVFPNPEGTISVIVRGLQEAELLPGGMSCSREP